MEFGNFLKTWRGAAAENKFHRTLLLAQSVALVVALIGWQSKDRVTVVVPPTLSEKAEVALQSASVGYKKSWALYVAELLGNITPSNVDFVVESLSSMMTGENYEKFRTMAALQVEKIKRDGMSIQFEPRSVQYERDTDKLFVSGNSIVDAAGVKTPQTFTRVFEVKIDIKNGMPHIGYIDTYQGQPRTREVLERLEKEAAVVKRNADAQEDKQRAEARAARKAQKDSE